MVDRGSSGLIAPTRYVWLLQTMMQTRRVIAHELRVEAEANPYGDDAWIDMRRERAARRCGCTDCGAAAATGDARLTRLTS